MLYRMRNLKLVCVIAVSLIGAACAVSPVKKPSVIEFGASQIDMELALRSKCSEVREHLIETVQVPGAQRQSQIDCIDFDYFGAPRLAEFVFADDELILTWILLEDEELAALEAEFVSAFGPPSFQSEAMSGFFENFAAVRKDVPEALYYSPSVAPIVEMRMAE